MNIDILTHILRYFSAVEACQVAVVLRLDRRFLDQNTGFQKLRIDTVARHGFVELLDAVYKNKSDEPWVSSSAIDDVCSAGHVNILRYLYESGRGFHYSNKAMDSATRHNQVAVLEWFQATDLTLKYSPHVVEIAAARGKLAAMKWWLDSTLPITGNIACMKKAMKGKQLGAVKLWLESDKLPKPTDVKLNGIYDTDILDVWSSVIRDGVVKADAELAFHTAAIAGKIHVLDWFFDSGIRFEQYSDTLYFVSQQGHDAVLQWFAEHDFLRKILPMILELSKRVATGQAVSWWQRRDLVFSKRSLDTQSHLRCRFLRPDEKQERLIMNKKDVILLP